MSKWNYLIEADEPLRRLERKWKQSGSDGDAKNFVQAAKRMGATKGSDFNKASWQIGERPSSMSIESASNGLSWTLDQVIVTFNEIRGGGSQLEAGGILIGDRGPSKFSNFMTGIERGFEIPGRIDFDDIEKTADIAKKIVPNLAKYKVDARTSKHFTDALAKYEQLLGR